MHTDQSNKIFSILKNASDRLVFSSHDQKFIRKTFVLKEETLNYLIERQKITHQSLINLHRIEFSHKLSDDKFAVEIVFDHYCKTLEECMIGENPQWDDSEIINTFEPIVELIDHLVSKKIALHQFSLKNIVITEDQSIKFVDSFMQNKQITRVQISKDTNNFNEHKIYLKIAENIFNLVCPKDSSTNWKSKMKVLKQKNSKQMCTFVSSVLAKSVSKGSDISKTKRIKKTVKVLKNQNIESVSGKLHKEEKKEKDGIIPCQINMYGKHQGKQNKLQQ